MPSKTVLIIEDDQSVRDTLRLTTEFMGYSTLSAEHGGEGLELLSKIEPPCLIILDMMMPVMNGWEFLGHVSKDTQLMKIPVLVISAFRDIEGLGKNVIGFLKKPMEINALKSFLEEHCGS